MPDGSIEFSQLLGETYREMNPRFSLDGNWVSYETTEESREVFIEPYPIGSAARRRITQNGGVNPVWSGNGRELFYENGGFS